MVRASRYLPLADIAQSQWGLITSAQARSVDISPQQLARMHHDGMLQRLKHGVYRLAGTPDDRLAEIKAAWLSLEPATPAADRARRPDPTGVVSSRSAARVRGLGDVDADVHEFSVSTAKRSNQPDIRLRKRTLTPAQWSLVDGLPTTVPDVIIGDLAGEGIDGGHLGGVIRDVILNRHSTFLQVAKLLRPYAFEYGAPLGDGSALTKALLGQAGLGSTIKAAARRDDEWLNKQLHEAAMRKFVLNEMVDYGNEVASAHELLGHAFYGAADQK